MHRIAFPCAWAAKHRRQPVTRNTRVRRSPRILVRHWHQTNKFFFSFFLLFLSIFFSAEKILRYWDVVYSSVELQGDVGSVLVQSWALAFIPAKTGWNVEYLTSIFGTFAEPFISYICPCLELKWLWEKIAVLSGHGQRPVEDSWDSDESASRTVVRHSESDKPVHTDGDETWKVELAPKSLEQISWEVWILWVQRY